MRATRSTSFLLLAAVLVLVPGVGLGGSPPPPVIDKGPFTIDPTSAEPDTPFELSVSGEDCHDPVFLDSASGSSGQAPRATLLGGDSTNVHVQVVGPRPDDTVLASEDYESEQLGPGSGDWGSPPTINFPDGLPAGTYLVTAECQHLENGGVAGESATSSGSTPAFVLLGNDVPEQAECTDESPVGTPGNLGPGCYEPQELVIEVAAAEAVEREPTFAG